MFINKYVLTPHIKEIKQLSRSARAIPKAIATFGEQQFKETGAAAVEVLRVKTAVMRKHFRKLQGIVFLVAVISLDRVRVYFFNSAGIMILGENLEVSLYTKIRKSSKLIAKFEKPKELTAEEMRIEATQELRDDLGKAIRRVSRFLSQKEPTYPDIYITRSKSDTPTQNFGLQITPDFELLFEESILSQKWVEGVLLRAAFLLHLPHEHWMTEAAHCFGNGIALVIQKEPGLDLWYDHWKKISKDTDWSSMVYHFFEHKETYGSDAFNWILSLIQQSKEDITPDAWISALKTIHDSIFIPLGTSEYHVMNGFCTSLSKPNQLVKRRYLLESIHIAPRVFCDYTNLNQQLGFSIDADSLDDAWASVRIAAGSKSKVLNLGLDLKDRIDAINYHLNLEDIFPSPSGPISHGKSIVRRALEKVGMYAPYLTTFQMSLELGKERSLLSKEIAVLERLSLGSVEVIANTLVGSPLIVKSLLEKGCIAFAPDFHHIGIDPDFLLKGSYDAVKQICESSLEATIFKADTTAVAVVSAPTSWRQPLLKSTALTDLEIWPIIDVTSDRRLLRYEETLVEGRKNFRWSDITS